MNKFSGLTTGELSLIYIGLNEWIKNHSSQIGTAQYINFVNLKVAAEKEYWNRPDKI